jgi:hypothetical protein
MRCRRAQEYLSEYIDGTLQPDREAALLRHVEQCADCRALLRDFEAIIGEARGLERLVPPDSAWLKIRAGIEQSGRLKPEPAFFRFRPRLATAAVTVVVLVALLGLLHFRPWQSRLSAEEAAVDKVTLTKLDEAERYYEQAVGALNEALAAQRGSLDPEVTRVFETNLAVVDASIETCRKAVRRDPRDLQAQYALLASYKNKVQLMTDLIAARRSSYPQARRRSS